MAEDVRRGLLATQKSLPPRLFYDALGSALFEAITQLPEYYLTRTEAALLKAHANAIAEAALAGSGEGVQVVELGAGSGTKSQLVLEALVARQGRTTYWPVDVSPAALEACKQRLEREVPRVEVRPLVMHHEAALEAIGTAGRAGLVLFIGSSIGNYSDSEAIALLGRIRRVLAPDGALLLGADRRKDPAILLAAYNDPTGVTAAFNKNVLGRINRELGGNFDLHCFEHRAVWNENAFAIEMHLVSTRDQEVLIGALDLVVRFARGESIHTETSTKYDDDRLDHILSSSGLVRQRDWMDPDGRFGVHWCVSETGRGGNER